MNAAEAARYDAEHGRPQGALEADGRLLCWRCRCDVDDDFFCHQCGAVSIPRTRQPLTAAAA